MFTLEVIRINTTKIHGCKWAFFNKSIFSLGKKLETVSNKCETVAFQQKDVIPNLVIYHCKSVKMTDTLFQVVYPWKIS